MLLETDPNFQGQATFSYSVGPSSLRRLNPEISYINAEFCLQGGLKVLH